MPERGGLKETSDVTPANIPEDNLESTNRPQKKSLLTWALKGWLLLLARTICSAVLSLLIVLTIKRYNAIGTTTPRYSDGKLHLRVSDITTLVSAGLVITSSSLPPGQQLPYGNAHTY